MKRIDGIFILLLGMLMLSVSLMAQEATAVAADGVPEAPVYDDLFASLAAIVAGVPMIIQAVKGFWKGMPRWVELAGNWVLGIAICLFGWWQDLGFLAGMDWTIALLYGIGAGLAASGFAETGLVQWLIGLFTRKKKQTKKGA